jgi:hypothetical protein
MPSEIAVQVDRPWQELQAPLEGAVYTLELRWSAREERWYLDVYDEDHDAIYTGVAVVLNFPLAIRCADARMWPGALFATDTSGANLEPGVDDFGDRVKLIYFDSTELPIVLE